MKDNLLKSDLIRWLDSVDSTNLEAERYFSDAPEGSVWAAYHQTAGRGQTTNIWESKAGKNLLFSLLLRPDWLPACHQFYISKAVSLGVYDFLLTKGIRATIKWPNDIMVGDKKIAGILIEHHLSGNALTASIVGVGININQEQFGDGAPNATSYKLETGCSTDIREELPNVVKYIMWRYQRLEGGLEWEIHDDYLSHLYRFDAWHMFEQNGERFQGNIVGVECNGMLSIENRLHRITHYAFQEIRFC